VATHAPGCGPIAGYAEDDDLTLLRDGVDACKGGEEPGEDFWAALTRREPFLRRTAKHVGLPIPPKGELLPPETIRVTASFMLDN